MLPLAVGVLVHLLQRSGGVHGLSFAFEHRYVLAWGRGFGYVWCGYYPGLFDVKLDVCVY